MIDWTQSDEKKMVGMIQKGGTYEAIAKDINKEPEDIEKRLKKVIYENIMGGKSIKDVSNVLRMSEEKIGLYFNSYRDYRKKLKAKQTAGNFVQATNSNNKVNFDTKIDMLEKENRFIKAILDNKKLRSEVADMVNKGKIDKSIKNIIDDFRNSK